MSGTPQSQPGPPQVPGQGDWEHVQLLMQFGRGGAEDGVEGGIDGAGQGIVTGKDGQGDPPTDNAFDNPSDSANPTNDTPGPSHPTPSKAQTFSLPPTHSQVETPKRSSTRQTRRQAQAALEAVVATSVQGATNDASSASAAAATATVVKTAGPGRKRKRQDEGTPPAAPETSTSNADPSIPTAFDEPDSAAVLPSPTRSESLSPLPEDPPLPLIDNDPSLSLEARLGLVGDGDGDVVIGDEGIIPDDRALIDGVGKEEVFNRVDGVEGKGEEEFGLGGTFNDQDRPQSPSNQEADPNRPRASRRNAKPNLSENQRRENHASSEQRRRDAIRIGYEELSAIERNSVNVEWPESEELIRRDNEAVEAEVEKERLRREEEIQREKERLEQEEREEQAAAAEGLLTTSLRKKKRGLKVRNPNPIPKPSQDFKMAKSERTLSKALVLRKGAALAKWLGEGNGWLQDEVNRLETLLGLAKSYGPVPNGPTEIARLEELLGVQVPHIHPQNHELASNAPLHDQIPQPDPERSLAHPEQPHQTDATEGPYGGAFDGMDIDVGMDLVGHEGETGQGGSVIGMGDREMYEQAYREDAGRDGQGLEGVML